MHRNWDARYGYPYPRKRICCDCWNIGIDAIMNKIIAQILFFVVVALIIGWWNWGFTFPQRGGVSYGASASAIKIPASCSRSTGESGFYDARPHLNRILPYDIVEITMAIVTSNTYLHPELSHWDRQHLLNTCGKLLGRCPFGMLQNVIEGFTMTNKGWPSNGAFLVEPCYLLWSDSKQSFVIHSVSPKDYDETKA